MERRINNYIRQIEQLYKGGSWNGESFLEKLDPLNENMAFTQPKPGNHSVAEILWHCIYWHQVAMKRMQGDFTFEENNQHLNFLPLAELRKKGWDTLLAEFDKSQNELICLLTKQSYDFLIEKYNQNNIIDFLVQGIVHHDIYHLGQIGLVISILKNNLTPKENFKTMIDHVTHWYLNCVNYATAPLLYCR